MRIDFERVLERVDRLVEHRGVALPKRLLDLPAEGVEVLRERERQDDHEEVVEEAHGPEDVGHEVHGRDGVREGDAEDAAEEIRDGGEKGAGLPGAPLVELLLALDLDVEPRNGCNCGFKRIEGFRGFELHRDAAVQVGAVDGRPRSREVVADGIVQGYFLGSYSARKLGLRSTGNAGGNHNLILRDTGAGFEDLLRTMGRGLLVTELLGHGVNAVTGDYSRGAAGFWVEGGGIAYPVQEITIAGNLKDIYRGIVAVGSDVVRRGSRQCGSILVERMTIAGD